MELVRGKLHLSLVGVCKEGDVVQGSVTLTLRADGGTSNSNVPLHTSDDVTITSVRASQGRRALKLAHAQPTITFDEDADVRYGDIDVVLGFRSCVQESPHGLYSCKPPTNALATFFEVSHARRLFPCPDTPELRCPWTISVDFDGTKRVLSNMPPKSTTTQTGAPSKIEFQETPPLPVYLLCLVVCDEVNSVTSSVDPRVVLHVPRGITYPHANDVVCWAAKCLLACESYFGYPLDVDMLQIVPLPRMEIGGMEQHGLITLNCKDTVSGTKSKNPQMEKVSLCELVCHEVVHHWIGNILGMPFQLKEGFAQYFEVLFADEILGRSSKAKKVKSSDLPTNEGLGDKVFTGDVYVRSLNEVKMLVEQCGVETVRSRLSATIAENSYRCLSSEELMSALRSDS